MITAHAACLVRRWVALYTHGLPTEPRDRRREEVEGDLWSQAEESRGLGRGDRTTAVEMVIRLATGIPADIAWRLEHGAGPAPTAIRGERSFATGGVAILGGMLFSAALVIMLVTTPAMGPEGAWSDPVLGPTLVLTTMGGILGLALATFGLVVHHLSRLRGVSAALGAFAFLAGAIAALGPFQLVIILAIGSAVLVAELVSIRALDRRVAGGHIAAAVGFVAVVGSALAGAQVTGFAAIALPYPISWIVIGNALLRGPSIGDLPAQS